MEMVPPTELWEVMKLEVLSWWAGECQNAEGTGNVPKQLRPMELGSKRGEWDHQKIHVTDYHTRLDRRELLHGIIRKRYKCFRICNTTIGL
jgi:hypothetical protein